MDRYTETFETWNQLAFLYEKKFMDLKLYDQTYDRVLELLPQENASLLDMGCGPGNITRYMLFKKPDLNIFGIDIAENMIAIARKNNPTARFARMDSRDIAQLTEKYDGIISGFCLPYLSESETKKCIADCGSLLNENGILYISFVEGDPDSSGFQVSHTGSRVYFYYHKLKDLQQQLQENNFEQQELLYIEYSKSEQKSEMHTILIARKKAAHSNPHLHS